MMSEENNKNSSSSSGGEGGFILDEQLGFRQSELLLIQAPGETAALKLEVPFDLTRVDRSSVSVEIVDGQGLVLADGFEYAELAIEEKGAESLLKIGVLCGRKEGFGREEIRLRISSVVLGEELDQRVFQQAPVVERALDRGFQENVEQIRCRWLQG